MKRQATVKGNKVIMTKKANGDFTVALTDRYKTYKTQDTFSNCMMFVFELADNNEIGAELNRRMCKAFGMEC